MSKEHTAASWDVLKKYGNMLSPSFLFVLEEQMQKQKLQGKIGMAFSFAPGVGIEGLLLYVH